MIPLVFACDLVSGFALITFINRKLQKSLAELQKLHEEKAGTNLYSSTHVQDHQKVILQMHLVEVLVNYRKILVIRFSSIHLSTIFMQMLKGQLFVDRFCEKVQYSFLDYISSGFELNFMVAIDFTGMFNLLMEKC